MRVDEDEIGGLVTKVGNSLVNATHYRRPDNPWAEGELVILLRAAAEKLNKYADELQPGPM